jgi:hypothetical protein
MADISWRSLEGSEGTRKGYGGGFAKEKNVVRRTYSYGFGSSQIGVHNIFLPRFQTRPQCDWRDLPQQQPGGTDTRNILLHANIHPVTSEVSRRSVCA